MTKGLFTRELLIGIALILAAAVYRALVFWAENAWDLASPLRVFVAPLALCVVSGLILLVTIRRGFRPLPTAFAVGSLLFIALNWSALPLLHPLAWLGLSALASVVFYLRVQDTTLRLASIVVLTVLLVAPALQVVIHHYQQRIPYPLVDLAAAVDAHPTGIVEDLVIVIVDSYPMLHIAREWFHHDTKPIEDALAAEGFSVEEIAWSHNTFTGLSVPSIVQLHQVVDASAKGSWGNRRSSYENARGENFIAGTLRNAGFRYTHIESGWDGDVCGPVDSCKSSGWLDESNWNVLEASLIGDVLAQRLGSVDAHNTIKTVEHLKALDIFGNGTHDYVYAHLMLPHPPYVVDSNCQVVPMASRLPTSHESIRLQLECVDSLIESFLPEFDNDTAILITGDHGTGLGEPSGSSREWTDEAVAERLGIFMSYRAPSACGELQADSNVEMFRILVGCAVIAQLPSGEVPYMLGANQPVEVDRSRLDKIRTDLLRGVLLPREPR